MSKWVLFPGKILELIIIQICFKLLVKNMIMKRVYHIKKHKNYAYYFS